MAVIQDWIDFSREIYYNKNTPNSGRKNDKKGDEKMSAFEKFEQVESEIEEAYEKLRFSEIACKAESISMSLHGLMVIFQAKNQGALMDIIDTLTQAGFDTTTKYYVGDGDGGASVYFHYVGCKHATAGIRASENDMIQFGFEGVSK